MVVGDDVAIRSQDNTRTIGHHRIVARLARIAVKLAEQGTEEVVVGVALSHNLGHDMHHGIDTALGSVNKVGRVFGRQESRTMYLGLLLHLLDLRDRLSLCLFGRFVRLLVLVAT